MIIILQIYWLVTTIIGAIYLAKNDPRVKDEEYFSIASVIANIFPSMVLSPIGIPLYLLSKIKFKK